MKQHLRDTLAAVAAE